MEEKDVQRLLDMLYSMIDEAKSAAFSSEKCTINRDEALDLLDEILPLIVTDMDKRQIVEYVLKCAPMLATADYGTQQIPANGTFKQGFVQVREGLKNWFQYNIDFGENRRILQSIMNGNR